MKTLPSVRKGFDRLLGWVMALSGMELGFLSAVAWLGFLGYLDQLPSGPALMALLWAGVLLGGCVGRGVFYGLSKRKSAIAPLKRRLVWAGALATLVLTTMAFHEPILIGAGEFLIVGDEPKPADVIWILGSMIPGAGDERYVYGLDLFQQGFGKRLVLSLGTREVPMLFRTETVRNNADLLREYFASKGVDPGQLTVLEAKNTYDEARLARDYLQKSGMRSALIVTSPEHMRRARMIFRRVVGDAAELTMVAVPRGQSEFHAHWWRDRYSLGRVLYEYVSLAYYYVRYGVLGWF